MFIFQSLSQKKYLKKVPDSFLTQIFRFLTPKNIRIDALKDGTRKKSMKKI